MQERHEVFIAFGYIWAVQRPEL